jgi:hypothetical protein
MGFDDHTPMIILTLFSLSVCLPCLCRLVFVCPSVCLTSLFRNVFALQVEVLVVHDYTVSHGYFQGRRFLLLLLLLLLPFAVLLPVIITGGGDEITHRTHVYSHGDYLWRLSGMSLSLYCRVGK